MENLQRIALLIDADNTQLAKLEDVIQEISTPVSYTHLTLPTNSRV